MSRIPVLAIRDPDQWRALLSPIRMEMVQALRRAGPCSVPDLAAMLGRRADRLYHHVGVLTRAGVVREVGTRAKPRHPERVIDLVADDVAMELSGEGERRRRETIAATARAFLRSMDKCVASSAAAGALRIEEPGRNFILNYEVGRLTPEEFVRARALHAELKRLIDRARSNPEGEPYVAVVALCPMTTRRPRPSGTGRRRAPRP